MTVRVIDEGGDWLFGKGKNDYLSQNDEVAQDIVTRLRSFLGDCFFDQGAGIDWFNLLGSKNTLALDLAIKTVILNTPNVTGIIELSSNLDQNRQLSVVYEVNTVFPGTIKGGLGVLLTEDGLVLLTESGDNLHA